MGWPDTAPDHISLWGSLLKFRREFDQYINLRPVRLFELMHGSAPDIYGKSIANPIAIIWSDALMLKFLGHIDAHDAILRALEHTLKEGPCIPDLGGTASTKDVGATIERMVLQDEM